MLFSDLLGNGPVKHLLERMVLEGTVPQVLLFSGSEGIGKGLFARRLASGLMGEKHHGKIVRDIHPDVHRYFPEGKLHLHPIASIQKILEESALPPFEGPVKVFIIDDVECMLASSSNALLKSLEEPLEDTYFILLTKNPRKVLPTVLSRCQKINFSSLSKEEVAQFLMKEGGASEDAEWIARFSLGSLATAKTFLSNKGLKQEVLEWMTLRDYPDFLRKVQEVEKDLEILQDENPQGYYQKIDMIFACILYYFRDNCLLHHGKTDDLFYEERKLGQTAPSLESALQLIEKAKGSIHHSVKFKTVLEELFLTL